MVGLAINRQISFAAKDNVGAIGRQEVRASCHTPEESVPRGFQFGLALRLSGVDFDAWRGYALDALALELQLFQELLHLPGVCLIFQASVRPSDDAVKDAGLLVVHRSWAEASAHGQLVALFELALEPVQLVLGPRRREIVSMDGYSYPSLLVVENAG